MVGSVFSIPVRVAFSALLLAVPFIAGMSAVSAWWILPMAFVFVTADIMGKWRLMFAGKPIGNVVAFALKALAVQPIVVGVVYLLGRGLGSMTGAPNWSPFADGMTAEQVGLYALVMFGAGLVLIWAERGRPSMEDAVKAELDRAMGEDFSGATRADLGLEMPAERLTPETFFSGHHYSHVVYDEDHAPREVKPEAFVGEEEIAAKEAELAIRLPALVRGLYLRQNGGSVKMVYSGDAAAPEENDLTPFSGYEDLAPLGDMRSLKDAIGDYAYEDQLEMFPKGAERMIILAQWYRETLFLDYRGGREEPRVGFYDFDASEDLQDDSWEADAHWWEDFDAFFATLYRQNRFG